MRSISRFVIPLPYQFLAISSLLLCLTNGRAAAQAQADGTTGLQAKLTAIESLVEAKQKELHVPGVALAIVKDDKVLLMKGFGLRDIEHNLPVDADTLFGLASSTKAFTAMAAAMAADEGKLSLDDSPKKYLPYFRLQDPDADAKVTIRDLLSNRSGLGRADLPLMFSDKLTRAETIQLMGSVKPTAKLRAAFQYQNIMFSAAGEAVASAEGTTWEKDIAVRILKPLGMTSTNTSLKELLAAKNRTLGYEYHTETGETKPATLLDLTSTAPDGAINSSARDMVQWLRLMLGGGAIAGKRIVSEKSFGELVKRHIEIAPGVNYGLGWILKQWRGAQIVEHGGNLPGFSTEVAMMPDQQLGVVLLMNVYFSPLGEIVKEAVWSNLSGIAEGTSADASAPPPLVESNGPDEARARAANPGAEVGTYQFREWNGEAKVSLNKGRLFLELAGNPLLPLNFLEGRKYEVGAPAPPGVLVTFRPSGDGSAEMFIENSQGKFVLSKKKPFVAAISIDDLMTKNIAAMGGDKNLRVHTTKETTFTKRLENQGITSEGIERSKAPNLEISTETLSALGKKLGTVVGYFDGKAGGASGFGRDRTYTGERLEAVRIASDFFGPLNWKSNFKTVVITGLAKVANNDAYVVEKTSEKGEKVVDFISTESFLLLETKTVYSDDTSPVRFDATSRYEDYREVGGVMIPFRTVETSPLGEVVKLVQDVKFDVKIPDDAFQAPTIAKK
jgi:CubicO group peptidase (beta-lactamase class C family)